VQVRNDSKTRGARMKIAVTGGAGFIGSNLCQKLSEEHEVVVVDNFSSGKRENLTGLGVTPIRGEHNRSRAAKKSLFRVDCVFHEAAIVSVQRSVDDPLPTNDVNIGGTLKVLTAARDCGAKKAGLRLVLSHIRI
jgi:UDP-glucose 4-epimerase